MNENLFRPQFDTLKLSDKLWLMQTLATSLSFDIQGTIRLFPAGDKAAPPAYLKRWPGVCLCPGRYRDSWLGELLSKEWTRPTKRNWRIFLRKSNMRGSAEEFLRQGMTPVRQVTIGPMFVGRKLEEIGWESVPMNDPHHRPPRLAGELAEVGGPEQPEL